MASDADGPEETFNVAASIKMRKYEYDEIISILKGGTFNVAASIKMRK